MVRERFGVRLNEFYGQTEANLLIGNCAAWPGRPGWMGRAYPGHEVRLIDGEIAVRVEGDPVVFLGYWRNEEATAAKVRDGWLHTGDLAEADDDGTYRSIGRVDDLISSGGYRIGPGEIEECLIRHPAVSIAAAIGTPDEVRGEVVKAFVVTVPGARDSPELAAELQQLVRTRLAPYGVPREIEFVDELPLTVTGKIRRGELRRLDAERRGRGERSGPEARPVELEAEPGSSGATAVPARSAGPPVESRCAGSSGLPPGTGSNASTIVPGANGGEVDAHFRIDVQRDGDSALRGERLHGAGRRDAADRGDVESQHVERTRLEERPERPDVRHLVPDADGMAAAAPDRRAALCVLRDERILEPGERRVAPVGKLGQRLVARAPAVARVHDEARRSRQACRSSLEEAPHARPVVVAGDLEQRVPGRPVADDVLCERLRAAVGERVRGDHHQRSDRVGAAQVAPERHAGRLRGDIPERDVDEADRAHDEAGAPDRHRRAGAVLPAPLRIRFAPDHDRCDEPFHAGGDRPVPGQAVRLPDEAVARSRPRPRRTRAP